MGVHGLWKLLDSSGKPVRLETLENKVLAVDVSIWLHQAMKGFQDSQGNSVPNAHLLGLFHRVCKLLFYKIKPVFVFDGGVPHLKKQTVATRRQQRNKAESEADRVREQLLKNLVKDAALRRVLGNSSINPDLLALKQQENDMYKLPPEKPSNKITDGSDADVESEDEMRSHRNWSTADLHAIDVNSSQFKSLPADVRHDILSELKETRKQSSWGRLHEIPKESSDFSSYQMSRLLKRRSVQVSLEDAEREMGGRSLSMGEVETLLNEQGVLSNSDAGKRIASDSTTRYLYVKELGDQILFKRNAAIKTEEIEEESICNEKTEDICNKTKEDNLKDVLELISEGEKRDWSSNSGGKSCEEEKLHRGQEENLKIAQNFIFENSGLTQEQILAVIQYQNAVENEIRSDTENLLPIDQPSTSGLKQLNKKKELSSPEKSSNDETAIKNNIVSSSKINEPSTSGHGESKPLNKKLKLGSPIKDKKSSTEETVVEGNLSKTDGETSTKGCYEGKSITKTSSCKANEPMMKPIEVNTEVVSSKLTICSLKDELFPNVPAISMEKDHTKFKTNVDCKSDEPLKLTNAGIESTNVTGDSLQCQQLNSESDNESLIEVNDDIVSQPNNGAAQNKTLEVVIQMDKTCVLEDDIFADVFSDKTSEKSLTSANDKVATVFDSVNEKAVINLETNENEIIDDKNENLEEETKNYSDSDDEEVESFPNVNSSPKQQIASTSKMSSEELQLLQASLEKEQRSLLLEQGREERIATSITDQMYMEAQELLQLFGVPYIVAPMEAEAQCAFLDLASLTDGTITDDSDIWLFGGQKVYKNFFNQKKHVMCFKSADIKQCFKLERHQLILLALLVGSDYTPGLQGVGPVTALEILAAFPATAENTLAGLQTFRNWLTGGMKVGPGRTPLKNKLKNVQFIEGFPNLAVVDAYLNPSVDESREAFSWQFPDIDSLRDFTKRKFKWTTTKSDEILLPVMKKLEERKSQRSLDSYFKIIPKFHAAEGRLSKRVKQAINRIGGTVSSESKDDPNDEAESLKPERRLVEPRNAKPVGIRSRRRGLRRGANVTSTEQNEHTPGTNQHIPVPSQNFPVQNQRLPAQNQHVPSDTSKNIFVELDEPSMSEKVKFLKEKIIKEQRERERFLDTIIANRRKERKANPHIPEPKIVNRLLELRIRMREKETAHIWRRKEKKQKKKQKRVERQVLKKAKLSETSSDSE